MESTEWAPEHSAALTENLAQGMSYSEIARTINAKFGTNYSRNAALGRAKRIGLWWNPPPRELGATASKGGATESLQVARTLCRDVEVVRAGVRTRRESEAALRRCRSTPSFPAGA